MAIVDGWENGILHCTQRNKFSAGDEVEILAPGRKPVSLTVESITDAEGIQQPSANHAMMKFTMPSGEEFPKGSIIRKASDK